MKKSLLSILACAVTYATCAAAEPQTLGERVLFDAGRTAASVWQAGEGMQCHLADGKLTVALLGQASGWAAPGARLAYDGQAQLVVEPARIERGKVTVQVEWFAAMDRFIEATAALHDLDAPQGPVKRTIADLLPPRLQAAGAEKPRTFRVKVWLEGEGAAATFATLRLVAPRRWKQPNVQLIRAYLPASAAIQADDGLTATRSDDAIVLKLAEHQAFAGLVLSDRVAFDPAGVIMFDLASITDGSVALQAVCFDAGGNYLESVDLLKGIGAGGLYEVALSSQRSRFPVNTAQLQFKLWLGGHKPEARIAGLFFGVADEGHGP